jgi:hypothetical protein
VREKLTRDEESRDIIEMLYKNAFVDLADTIFLAVRGEYANLFRQKSNSITSHTEKIAPKMDELLEKAVAAFLDTK